MFETPLRSAALGVLIVAGLALLLSQSDRLIRLVNRSSDRDGRDAMRARFRNHVLLLVGIALALVLISEILR